MRLNQFLARYTSLSRRAADAAIAGSRVEINGVPARLGDIVIPTDKVTLDRHVITTSIKTLTLILNKPAGYVCSRSGQGSRTVYDLLPAELRHLNPVGRLDKNSSGLLLMTNNGQLANRLAHPSYGKVKIYVVALDKPLAPKDKTRIETGVSIGDERPSKFSIETRGDKYEVHLHEGRNRQIRRTFAALGYKVIKLHRTSFGDYVLSSLQQGKYSIITSDE